MSLDYASLSLHFHSPNTAPCVCVLVFIPCGVNTPHSYPYRSFVCFSPAPHVLINTWCEVAATFLSFPFCLS
jgi:hypothetical protein